MTNHEAKMPEMPPAAYVGIQRGEYVAYYTADQMRTMYLDGITDAKACVPARASDCGEVFFNACRNLTLANLKALEEDVAKGPALERTASGANFPKKEEAKK